MLCYSFIFGGQEVMTIKIEAIKDKHGIPAILVAFGNVGEKIDNSLKAKEYLEKIQKRQTN